MWLAGPIAWIAIASTQPIEAVALMPPRLSANLDLSGYVDLVTDPSWQGAAAVSITVTVAATLIALVVAILAGYPLARFRLRGARLLLLALLATMLIPPIALGGSRSSSSSPTSGTATASSASSWSTRRSGHRS